jgi:hypothetical protein
MNATIIEHSEPGRLWYTVEVDGLPLKTAAGRARRFMTGYAAQRAIDAERADRARRALRPDWFT